MTYIFVRFSTNVEFPDRFTWKPPMPKFTKIRPLGAALILADTRTDIIKKLGASHDYSNAPQNKDLSKFSTVITSFSSSVLMALRHKKTCTAEETSQTFAQFCVINACSLHYIASWPTGYQTKMAMLSVKLTLFLLLETHKKRSKIVFQKSGNLESQNRWEGGDYARR